ncbi:hypothetical protein ACQ5SI_17265 [Peribacillus frigoritolerans]|uniref:hypothetical protein n=1 Tax=Peribacillus frigoritolerans TaxID=450367 RepID=UPI003D348246
MIKIYIYNIEREFLEEANKKLNELLNYYFHPFDDDGEEFVFDGIFPKHLYRTNKEKCIKTTFELREYVNDLSSHSLTPLHEYALLKILYILKDLEEDENRYVIKKEIDNEEIESDKNGGYFLEDIDIDFFITYCFQDHDFYEVERIFEIFVKDPTVEDFASINLEEYEDLVSEDIFREYKRIKKRYKIFKNLMRDNVSLEKQNGEVVNNILSYVEGNEIFILDTSLDIEEGDRITRISNGQEEAYIITNSDSYGNNYSIPAHYELRVHKETAFERIQAMIINNQDNSITNITGNNNRTNIRTTDNSKNTSIKVTEIKIFNQIKEAIKESDILATEKDKLISNVSELEESVGTSNYQSKYQNFIASAANHMTIIAPFIPELTKLLGI